jgi:drug/metabolite transporter (DMT)-like permease
MDLISYIFPVYSGGAAVVLLIGLVAGVSFFGYSSRTYALFLMLALVPQLIGHSTFNWALKFFSASTVAVLILGEPIGSTLLAYLILGETLSVWKVIGGICILAGIYTAIRGDIMGADMIISTERG